MKIELDHFYFSVDNMDRAISFYEQLLNIKAKHREHSQWADFDLRDGIYFGLIGSYIIDKKRIVGNNATLVFKTDNVDEIYNKALSLGAKIISKPTILEHCDYYYKCFSMLDTEGNLIEVADYDKDSRL